MHFAAEESEMQTGHGAALTHGTVLVIPIPLPNPYHSPTVWLQSQNPLYSYVSCALIIHILDSLAVFFKLLLFPKEFEVKHLRFWTTGSYLSPLGIKVSSFILPVSLSSRKAISSKHNPIQRKVVADWHNPRAFSNHVDSKTNQSRLCLRWGASLCQPCVRQQAISQSQFRFVVLFSSQAISVAVRFSCCCYCLFVCSGLNGALISIAKSALKMNANT